MKKSNLYLSIIIAFSFGIVHGQTSLFNSKTKTPKADITYQLSLSKATEGNKEVTINNAKALSSIHYYQNSEGNTVLVPTMAVLQKSFSPFTVPPFTFCPSPFPPSPFPRSPLRLLPFNPSPFSPSFPSSFNFIFT